MLGRAATTLEGIVRELHPRLDVAAAAKPYAERLLKDRVAPENVQTGLYRALLQFEGMSHELPLQLSQIVSDLSTNRFGVRVSGRPLEQLSASILSAAYTVSGAILGGAFIIGSFIGLAQADWTIGGVPLVGVVGAVVGLSCIFWLGTYVLLRPRLKKLSLVRLLWKAK
jgi:ubiquinone biosynthesis protein